jgi:hypothetical protein
MHRDCLKDGVIECYGEAAVPSTSTHLSQDVKNIRGRLQYQHDVNSNTPVSRDTAAESIVQLRKVPRGSKQIARSGHGREVATHGAAGSHARVFPQTSQPVRLNHAIFFSPDQHHE